MLASKAMKKDPSSFRIAHLSDPHFSSISYSPKQFLSKRWMGNLNLMLFRYPFYQTEHLWHLPELVENLEVESVFVTGDFSSTSLDEEFAKGKQLIDGFKEKNLPTFAVPGNHDCYTAEASKHQDYYRFLSSNELRDKKIEKHSLGKGWWYIGLDCAVSAPLFCAYGNFFEETEKHLEQALLEIPKNERVIIANHFPLYPHNRPKHDLKRADALQALLKRYPQVKLYLHGHDHGHYIVDRQEEGLPLVLNSGSAAHKPNGTFYVIDLFEEACLVQKLLFSKKKGEFSWVLDWQKNFKLL
ncbi:MAG: 3',5'-cyclic adenosine monophosphate phosphodiesterase CpdA [Chlamydiales bacterium]|nr:3',5'-cyclic adenosine monophosphate phosphodiesterase CpdA [Chlamydiales bacterium]